MSINLNDDDVATIAMFLSAERLAALKTLTGSTRDAIELHQQTLQIGGALMSVTAVIEIALRNAICDQLTQHFAAGGWLFHPPRPFAWRSQEKKKLNIAQKSARRAVYAKLSQADKHALDSLAFPNGVPTGLSHNDKTSRRQDQIPVSGGKVIAELTLYFWKRLFSGDYEAALWEQCLKKVFPYKKLRRTDIALHLEQIYQTRNRLAHHEPVCGRRLDDTLIAIKFIAQYLGSSLDFSPKLCASGSLIG